MPSKITLFLVLTFFIIGETLSQDFPKIELTLAAGPQANFFVRSYDEENQIQPSTYFLKKNLIGPALGFEIRLPTSSKNALSFGYVYTSNRREISYQENFNNLVFVQINHFNIRHVNHYFQLAYNRKWKPKNTFIGIDAGIFYLRSNQQEIGLENFINTISIDERNYKNSRLEEAGVMTAIEFQKRIDTHFLLGLKTRFYFLASTLSMESVMITPTLSYQFGKK